MSGWLPGASALDREWGLTQGVITRRVLAWVVDSVLIGLAASILAVALMVLGLLTFGLTMPLLGALWIAPILYAWLFVAGTGQATPGHALCGLCVVQDADLSRPNSAQALVWSLLYWVTAPISGGLLLLLVFLTRRHRALHDVLSGLTVVRTEALSASSAGWVMGAGIFPQ